MTTKKNNISQIGIAEEKIFSKPKHEAILSLIACFQQNKKNIQRGHLILALVKNVNPKSVDDKNLFVKVIIDRIQALSDITPKIMFNSIANLDKTVQYLRKLGLITNQYVRGYPRIILTDKGLMLFYKYIIKRMGDELVDDGKQLMNISHHIFTSFIPKEKIKTLVSAMPEFYFPDDY